MDSPIFSTMIAVVSGMILFGSFIMTVKIWANLVNEFRDLAFPLPPAVAKTPTTIQIPVNSPIPAVIQFPSAIQIATSNLNADHVNLLSGRRTR